MTTATHTPGAWHIEPLGVIACDEFMICEVFDADPRNDNPEMTANARLIAAAPELLEACKMALHIAWETGTETDGEHQILLDDSRGDLYRTLRDAIAKATA